MSTPVTSLSREELEAAFVKLQSTLEKLQPVIRAAVEAMVDNIEPFMASVMELKQEQPWLFEEQEPEIYDFDGNDLDAPAPDTELTPHEFVPTPGSVGASNRLCAECGRPELHFVHDEEEVAGPPSIEELEEEAERALLRGKGS